MRTQLELWNIVDENFDRYFTLGLCRLFEKLNTFACISDGERKALSDELAKYGNNTDYFLGACGDPAPRKEFIQKMIAKHESN